MARTHFINPYTFIPLSEEGPLIQKGKEPTHAWFDKVGFTGIIECQLSFFTPAVIPGFQKQGTQHQAGEIKTYTYKKDGEEYLAIPGSRIRGHLLNLMRAINSSPITVVQERVILDRRKGDPQKGILLKDKDDNWVIQEIKEEILVAHTRRTGNTGLKMDCSIAHIDNDANTDNDVKIPDFDPNKELVDQGMPTKIYYQNPSWPPESLSLKKFYLAQEGIGQPLTTTGGRWVKISSWSGQDGENALKDIRGNRSTHRNAWHLINLENIVEPPCPLDQDVTETYGKGIDEMAHLIYERDADDRVSSDRTFNAKNLKSGTFLYFTADSEGKITSFGQHYHYLNFIGSVSEKTSKANEILNNGNKAFCAARSFSGWANDKDTCGMKGRLWVEMAMGPKRKETQVEEKNLRILSSQPPKAACFYLKNGDYQISASAIRGRKFYWHYPDWDKPMWDNEDSNEGQKAFENPFPNNNKKQWAKAEIIMACKAIEKRVPFKFRIRLMNVTKDELNLLLTALVGLCPIVTDKMLTPSQDLIWCHKIGHARPYMGSCKIQITGLQELYFDESTYLPGIKSIEDSEIVKMQSSLHEWQKEVLKGEHIEMVKRIMNYQGAYQAGESEHGARITYPLTPVNDSEMIWTDNDRNNPKTYEWFKQNKSGGKHSLPIPKPGFSQALPVIPVRSSGSHTNPPAKKKPANSGSNSGAFAAAFANAQKSKQSKKGGK